jgi:hypothetical protein
MNPPRPLDTADDPEDEFQGDVHAADIVSPTGEEMPVATHAEVHGTPEPKGAEARGRSYCFHSHRVSD